LKSCAAPAERPRDAARPADRGGRPLFALVGSPNSGKTTLFNALTGHRARTGNYPGVTVERREGPARTPGGEVELLDLPGSYSLHALAEDERVAVAALQGEYGRRPDAVLVVADSTTLERSLALLAEVLALGHRACLVLTMVDELKARGGELDLARLQAELRVPVVPVVGHRGLGIDDLRQRLAEWKSWTRPELLPPDTPEARFAWADAILARCRRRRPGPHPWTRRLDALLLHPVAGPLVFLVFVAAFFQAIFSWAGPVMDLFAGALEGAADWTLATFPDSLLTRLLADGILRGVGAVVVFLPQIALLFTVILFLEACGYMARAAFVVDRLFGWIGLEGRCFVALLSSYACAVPGILATRTIPSPRDRLATLLVAPFATCSARLPVYALLIAAFIPDERVFGPFTWQGLTLLGLYLAGGLTAVLFAALFKRGLLRGATLPFYLELPPYRMPRLRVIALQVWDRLWMFLRRAGTIILGASVLLWALLTFPGIERSPGQSEAEHRREVLEHSYAARLGKAVEPVFEPLGFDWRINVGLIASQAAREVMVSTLAQVYAWEGDEEDLQGLGEILRAPDPRTGRPRLAFPSALALLAWFAYSLQCVSTLAVLRRETRSWKWPAFAFAYMFATGWLAAWVVHTLAS